MSDAATGVRSLADRIAARMLDASVLERVVIALVATALALLIGAVIVAASGYDAVEFVSSLVYGAVGNVSNLAFMLRQSSMLILTGVAVAVAFRAGVFNIGVQGQFVVGGFAATLGILFAAPLLPNSPVSAIPLLALATLLALAAGGAYGALPGVMKAYAGANEVITTIMLNFIAAQIAFVLVSEFFGNPDSQVVETTPLPDWATLLPVAFPQGGDFSLLALAFGLALVVAVWFLLEQTSFGYDLRTSGEQPEAAEYGGVDAKRTTVTSMFLSGALGGMGGAIWVLMVMGKWQAGVPSLGFDGITVSILAGNNPFGVVPAALLFGTLKSGSLAVQFGTGVPKQLVGVLRGLIILFVAMPEFFRMLGSAIDLEPDRETVATDGGRLGGDDE